WHTYWINPGIGLPTELTWNLPQGWSADAIQWPTPIRIKDVEGKVTGNGYEGVVYLPVTITPPNNLTVGTDTVLKVKASWLMCAETCIPGEADLTLTLPV